MEKCDSEVLARSGSILLIGRVRLIDELFARNAFRSKYRRTLQTPPCSSGR